MKNSLVSISVFLLLHFVSIAQSNYEKETFVYVIRDSVELHLDKYIDSRIEDKEKRPVMIYVHGGGFSMGSRINALQIKYNKHFASQGFVSISIDYRKALVAGQQPDQESVLQAVSFATEDLIDATAFILSKSEEWNIDPNKIIISGGSAGAVTCLHAEYEICSGSDLAQNLPEGFNYAGIISHAGSLVIPQDTVIWKKDPCPMLLMHGDIDQAVPFEHYSLEGNLYAGSNYIHRQLIDLDAPHWLYVEEGADHIVALKPLQYNFGEIDTFIDKFILKGEHAVVHTVWRDKEPGSMAKMFDIVPLYMTGWDKTDEEVEAGN